MRKIMILGGSILQLPGILKAKEMGLHVITVDIDKNAIGFKYSDVRENISTIDIPGVVEIAKRYNIDGVMTLASDMPVRTIAAVAKEVNIPGISLDTAFKATNKALMRKCLEEKNIPIPAYYRVNEEKEYFTAISNFQTKCIIKPADNSGSRGIFLIEDLNDLEIIHYAYQYSKRYSHSGEIVVEEYMEGAEVSVEILSISGEVNVIGITDKITTGAPRFVEIGHSQPSMLNNDIKERVKEVAVRAVKAIGIKDGPSHVEIIITRDGPKVVELGARLGGDNIATHLIPLSTGIDIVKCCIEIALGEKPSLLKRINMGSAIRFFKTPIGKITNITGVEKAEKIQGVKEIYFTKNIGDFIEELSNSSDRVGYVIAQSDTAENAIQICHSVMDNVKIYVS